MGGGGEGQGGQGGSKTRKQTRKRQKGDPSNQKGATTAGFEPAVVNLTNLRITKLCYVIRKESPPAEET